MTGAPGCATELLLAPRSITAEDLGRIPPASDAPESSGAEAARAAAEGGARPNNDREPGVSSSAAPAPPQASGGSVVQLFEYLLALGVQAAAQRSRVPFAQVAHLARLTEDERELLLLFAPAVAPYLGAAGASSPIVGAIGFGVVGVMVLSGRFRDVRAAAPASPAKPSSERAAGSRAVDVEHLAKWGATADVVPPGTEIRDSGAFPEPQASAAA